MEESHYMHRMDVIIVPTFHVGDRFDSAGYTSNLCLKGFLVPISINVDYRQRGHKLLFYLPIEEVKCIGLRDYRCIGIYQFEGDQILEADPEKTRH